MNTFTLKAEGYKKAKMQVLIRLLIVFSLIIGFNLYLSELRMLDITFLMTTIPIIIFVIGVIIYSSLRKLKRAMDSYLLQIEYDTIIRVQEGCPTVSLTKDQIYKIIEVNGNIQIKSKDQATIIVVPESIENRELVKSLLTQFGEISTKNQKYPLLRYAVIISLTMVGYYYFFTETTSPLLTTAIGLLLLGSFVLIFYRVIVAKHINYRRKWIYLILLFPIYSIAMRVLDAILQLM